MALNDDIIAVRYGAVAQASAAQSTLELEQVRVAVLGKKGTLTALLRNMGSVPKEERAAVGAALNVARDAVEAVLAERKEALSAAELSARFASGSIDITLPGRANPIGSRHLISSRNSAAPSSELNY